MKTPEFLAGVNEKGALQMHKDTRRALEVWLGTLVGQKVIVTIKRQTKNRSTAQNRYWWGVVVEILANELGYQKDEMHDALKYKFLRLEAEPDSGGLMRVRSTTSLNTKEFTDLIENVITWAGAEFGIVIPLPGQVEAA